MINLVVIKNYYSGINIKILKLWVILKFVWTVYTMNTVLKSGNQACYTGHEFLQASKEVNDSIILDERSLELLYEEGYL